MTTHNYHRNKYVLPAFEFPGMIENFKRFASKNPDKIFVEKNNANRGIKIVKLSEVNYKATDFFYQVFMDKPLLFDNHMIDFSIYIAITSINPLRIYRYENEVHLRFCKEPYHPFDSKILDKYVVSDERLETVDIPSLNYYFENFGFSFRKSFEAYLTSQGHDVSEIWRQVDEAVVQVLLDNEPNFLKQVCKVIFFHLFQQLSKIQSLF
jgi:tubulin monoglycylase TTLL15